MSVRRLLEERRKGFISLHDVILRMMRLDGATYGESAQLLCQLLLDENERSSPDWYSYTSTGGKQWLNQEQAQDAWECLRQAAEYGQPPILSDDEIPF